MSRYLPKENEKRKNFKVRVYNIVTFHLSWLTCYTKDSLRVKGIMKVERDPVCEVSCRGRDMFFRFWCSNDCHPGSSGRQVFTLLFRIIDRPNFNTKNKTLLLFSPSLSIPFGRFVCRWWVVSILNLGPTRLRFRTTKRWCCPWRINETETLEVRGTEILFL